MLLKNLIDQSDFTRSSGQNAWANSTQRTELGVSPEGRRTPQQLQEFQETAERIASEYGQGAE